MPTFSLGRLAGAAVLGGFGIPHGQQKFHIVLLAPHQDQTKQGRRCSHFTYCIGLQWFLNRFSVALPARLPSPDFRGVFWTHCRTNISVLSQFVGEVFPHLGLCEFYNCAFRREVSHHGLFAKIPSLPLASGISGVGGRGAWRASAPPKVVIWWKSGKIPWKSEKNPWKSVQNLWKPSQNLWKSGQTPSKRGQKWRPTCLDLKKNGTQRAMVCKNGAQNHTTFFLRKFFGEIRAKILRIPKNLPAPTPMPEIILFRSLLKIQDHTSWSEQRPI